MLQVVQELLPAFKRLVKFIKHRERIEEKDSVKECTADNITEPIIINLRDSDNATVRAKVTQKRSLNDNNISNSSIFLDFTLLY
jgi:hypothetical protein